MPANRSVSGGAGSHLGPDAGEQVRLGLGRLPRAHPAVDQRARPHVLLPRERAPDDLVGQLHPEAVRVDLRAVGEERGPALLEVPADVDVGREPIAVVRETAFEPTLERALVTVRDVRLVQRQHPALRPAHVVHLRRLPGFAALREAIRIAGGVEGRS